ncbi:MAG: hypothetical protein AAFY10_01135 [Pseudomonadota bacterium]
MTGFGDPTAPIDGTEAAAPVPADDPGVLDVFGAAFEQMRATDLTNSEKMNEASVWAEYQTKVRALAPDQFEAWRKTQDPVVSSFSQADAQGFVNDPVFQRAIYENGLFYNSLPASVREQIPDPNRIELLGREKALERYIAASEVTGQARGALEGTANFAGGMTGAMTDPVNLAAMAVFRRPLTTFKGAVAYGAITSGATEIALQPFVQDYRAELGLPSGWNEGLQNVVFATVGGGVFGAAEGGVIKFGQWRNSKAQMAEMERGLEAMGLRGESTAVAGKLVQIARDYRTGEIDEEGLNTALERLADEEPAFKAALEISLRAREAAEVDGDSPLGSGPEDVAEHRSNLRTGMEAVLEEGPLPESAPPATPVEQPVITDLTADGFAMVDYADLARDPGRFQFKASDDNGETGALADVTEWSPERGGMILVWESADGTRFIANGHQRHALAQRLEAEGHAPIRGPAMVLREADGVSAEGAMVRGALINIAEGSGTSLDAARILRADPSVGETLPPMSPLVREARGLSRLSEDAFGLVVNERVSSRWASLVGARVDDQGLHSQLALALEELSPRTKGEAESMLADLQSAPVRESVNIDLFGDAEVRQSLIAERARVKVEVLRQLRRDRRSFGTLNRRRVDIEAVGNRLDTGANAKAEYTAARLAEEIEALAHVKGEISNALNEAAQRVANGEPVARAARGLVNALTGRAESGGPGRGGDAPGRGAAETEDGGRGQGAGEEDAAAGGEGSGGDAGDLDRPGPELFSEAEGLSGPERARRAYEAEAQAREEFGDGVGDLVTRVDEDGDDVLFSQWQRDPFGVRSMLGLDDEAVRNTLLDFAQDPWGLKARLRDGRTGIEPRNFFDGDVPNVGEPGRGQALALRRIGLEMEITRLLGGRNARALARTGRLQVFDDGAAHPIGRDHPTAQALTQDGRVLIFADRVHPDEIPGLLLHEVGVHGGMRAYLGEAGFSRTLAEVEPAIAAGDVEALAARARVPEDTPEAHILEETLAYWVQNAERPGPLLRRVYQRMRAWIYRNIPWVRGTLKMDTQMMRALAVNALFHRAREARAIGGAGRDVEGVDGDVLFSRVSPRSIQDLKQKIDELEALTDRARTDVPVVNAEIDRLVDAQIRSWSQRNPGEVQDLMQQEGKTLEEIISSEQKHWKWSGFWKDPENHSLLNLLKEAREKRRIGPASRALLEYVERVMDDPAQALRGVDGEFSTLGSELDNFRSQLSALEAGPSSTGLYSAALESARALPQRRMKTAEAIGRIEKGRGTRFPSRVKKEIATLGLREAFADQAMVDPAEIVAWLEVNQIVLDQVSVQVDARPKAMERLSRRAMLDAMSVDERVDMMGYADSGYRFFKRTEPNSYEAFTATGAAVLAVERDGQWSYQTRAKWEIEYSDFQTVALDNEASAARFVREKLYELDPESIARGMSREDFEGVVISNDSRLDAGEYDLDDTKLSGEISITLPPHLRESLSGATHSEVEGEIVNILWSIREDGVGNRSFFVRQLQSDEAKEVVDTRSEAKKELRALERDPDADPDDLKFHASEAEGENAPPVVRDTSTWVTASVRAILIQAARRQLGSVSFPTGKTSAEIQGNKSASNFYDTTVRGAVERLSRQLGAVVRKGHVESDFGDAEALVVDLTAPLRKQLRDEGLPLFSKARPGEPLPFEDFAEEMRALGAWSGGDIEAAYGLHQLYVSLLGDAGGRARDAGLAEAASARLGDVEANPAALADAGLDDLEARFREIHIGEGEDAGPSGATFTDPETGESRAVADMLEDLELDRKAIARLEGCAYPGGRAKG